jgi:hypothetical protein
MDVGFFYTDPADDPAACLNSRYGGAQRFEE